MSTPRTYRTPTLTTASLQGKKRKQSIGETCLPQKSLKVTIKQKPKTTSIPPPSDDRERDEIVKATLLSLTMHKTALDAEAQKNVANSFVDSVLNDDVDDFGTSLEPKSDKENPEVVDDDDIVNVIEKKNDEQKDDNAEKTNVAKEKNNDATGSMETRNEQMQTPIPSPNRSLGKDSSSDNIMHIDLD
ncbi:hypothetical protein Tco_0524326 [Tanacetum coccineum]